MVCPVEPVTYAETNYGDRQRILSIVRYLGPDQYARDADGEQVQATFRSFAEALEFYDWFVVREVDR